MKLAKTIPLRTTNAVNILSRWSISTANKLRHSLGFPSYPFSGKIHLASARGIFLAIRAEMWYNGDANNPSWRFFQPKALADKTVEAFFIFARNFEMAIGEYHKSDCNQSRGVPLTRSWEREGEREKGKRRREYIIYNYKQGRYITRL